MRNLYFALILVISLVSYGVFTFHQEPTRGYICGTGRQLMFFLPDLKLSESASTFWIPLNLSNYRFRCQDLPAAKLLGRTISLFPGALRILYPQLDIFLFNRSSAVLRDQSVSLRIENIGRGEWLNRPLETTPVFNLDEQRSDFELPVALTPMLEAEERATELRLNLRGTGFELSWLRRKKGLLTFLGRNYDGAPRIATCELSSQLVCENLRDALPDEHLPQEDLSVCEKVIQSPPQGTLDANSYLCLTSHIAKLAKRCDPELSRFVSRLSPFALPITTAKKVADCLGINARKSGFFLDR